MTDAASQDQKQTTAVGETQQMHEHPAHLAHHFDTPAQQFNAAKIGMWVFLATEVLMFGGLFVFYAVWRGNYPEVFDYAHHHLVWWMGFINTIFLIASSFTMAWGVRAAQLGNTKLLSIMLGLTIAGGCAFMVVKYFEYSDKYQKELWVGERNIYHPAHPEYPGRLAPGAVPAAVDPETLEETPMATPATVTPDPAQGPPAAPRTEVRVPPTGPTGLAPPFAPDVAVAPGVDPDRPLPSPELAHRIHQFFQIYFLMTGLHTLHVLIGIGLLAWLLVRALGGVFGPTYFVPVDIVGLYWHLVDLIWIFLFPLLYLIH